MYQKKINRYNDSIADLEHKTLINQGSADNTSNTNPFVSPLGWLSGLFLVAAVASGAVVNYRKQKKKSQKQPAPSTTEFKHSIEVIDHLGMKLIPVDDIAWLEKEGKQYYVHTLEDKSFRIKQTLEELEDALPADRFFRINRSVIINLQYISNYSFWENRKYIIRTKGTQQFVISSDRVKKLKKTYNITEG
jgi:DNA-binding LytR/AlgR family response regulator